MDTENGVLEWRNGRGKGVMEYGSLGVARRARPRIFVRDAGGGGKRWAGRRVQPGGSGLAVVKRTGFAHLVRCWTRPGPDNSTQVVDFPHLAVVSIFLEGHEMVSHGWNTDKTRMQEGWIRKAGAEEDRNERQEGLTTDGQRWTQIPETTYKIQSQANRKPRRRAGGRRSDGDIGKMACRSGVKAGLVNRIVVLNYTYLHVITRFYTMFLGVNVKSVGGGQRITRPALRVRILGLVRKPSVRIWAAGNVASPCR